MGSTSGRQDTMSATLIQLVHQFGCDKVKEISALESSMHTKDTYVQYTYMWPES